MALTTEQRAIIEAKFASFTEEERTVLGEASTQDLSEETAEIIAGARGQSFATVMASLVTGTISSFPNLAQAAAVADGATLYAALAAFKAAQAASDSNEALRSAVWVTLAALKHFRNA